MEITVTVTLDEAQQRAIERQLGIADTGETLDAFVSRMAAKVIGGWVERSRAEFHERNRPMIERLVEQLATDPDRDAKLAPLGLQFVGGSLEKLPPPGGVI